MTEQELVIMKTQETASIMVIDDDHASVSLLEYVMQAVGHEVRVASDGEAALAAIRSHPPDLLLLDVTMPGIDGFELTRLVREDPHLRGVLIILVTGRNGVSDKMTGLYAGADDFVVKPYEPAELVARVEGVLRRARELRSQSPLTGLPGNVRIEYEVRRRMDREQPFSLLYVDLDEFKAYNDRYGFGAGDRVLRWTAGLLQEVASEVGGRDVFVGHIGGDDFVIVCDREEAEPIAVGLVARFDGSVAGLYAPDDADRGHIEVVDRAGARRDVPLMGVSIGVADAGRRFRHAAALIEAASEMKAIAKRTAGSSWRRDRRSAPFDGAGIAARGHVIPS